MASRIEGDHKFVGSVVFEGSTTLPSSVISNTNVSASAAIDADKLQHRRVITFSQESGTTAANETWVAYVPYGSTWTLVEFGAGAVGLNTSTNTVAVDLKKNNTTMLTTPISLSASDTARVAKTATLSVTSGVTNDCLEIDIDQSSGSGDATGVFAYIVIDEDAA